MHGYSDEMVHAPSSLFFIFKLDLSLLLSMFSKLASGASDKLFYSILMLVFD